ncbi:glycosyltransferase family A protein [Salinibacterium sp. G-O1]|uniref:glycosyltransferase n=1 Tax=Salinibacterium sp. G-O1 TaxID=3046208 RepID=UPI0024B89C91|nr:glycosyltransferase family A protein [Salinibacterium sp. G-O1]MDJ0335588.1 glycosyltransferase family A protein [Salinibacterium sp. G-O1]
MDSPRPTVSIVIPAWNEEHTIKACVLAALEQTVPAFEVIVVDNMSTDGTAAVVKALQVAFPEAPLIYLQQQEAQGIIPTRNFGLDHAHGDILGRIDSDSVLEPTWVEEVQKAFADPEVAACTGPVIYYDMPLRRFGAIADDAVRRALIVLAQDYHLLFGSNMALRATAWQLIGSEACLDPDDELHEDIDLSIHLHEHAQKVAYSSEMVTGMSARRLDDNPREFYDYVMRFERTYQKHNVHNIALRAPMAVLMSAYPALKAMRAGELFREANEQRRDDAESPE